MQNPSAQSGMSGTTPGATTSRRIIPIASAHSGAASGGCSSSSCGSGEGPSDMPAHIWEKVKDHP
ncbi:MAG TPA: nitrogenase cofactor biosynthesis protein NifB, partial [Azospira sp.]|nr:nitrogenase cofactor biosynthesis protein NifB [Azospira sp.]